ncbi:MOSC domain-containing protein [Rathayibacter sp. AY1F7]|nr:MOSC domain-containing protein [Rathayibacter sp. AY1F2]PPH45042.1 MOSC domain-containing protein [Rathayibacter sp. AY1F7]PPI04534.1 MOSC domain-containing protein [Rathayibacter sp. AY1B8]
MRQDGGMTTRVDGLFVYPVKGLTPQPLPRVELTAGRGVPFDRTIALARPGGAYRPGMRHGISKREYFVLVAEARLAGLTTHLDPDSGVLTVDVRGHRVLSADLGAEDGRAALRSFAARVLDLPPGVEPVIAQDAGRRYTDTAHNSDVEMEYLSLINLASVRDLAERTGRSVDPLRFRGNIHLEGLPAWSELELLGRELTAGGLRLRITKATERCAATEVEPGTGRRDLPVPRLLHETYGHELLGVYAEVLDGGTLGVGDELVLRG